MWSPAGKSHWTVRPERAPRWSFLKNWPVFWKLSRHWISEKIPPSCKSISPPAPANPIHCNCRASASWPPRQPTARRACATSVWMPPTRTASSPCSALPPARPKAAASISRANGTWRADARGPIGVSRSTRRRGWRSGVPADRGANCPSPPRRPCRAISRSNRARHAAYKCSARPWPVGFLSAA